MGLLGFVPQVPLTVPVPLWSKVAALFFLALFHSHVMHLSSSFFHPPERKKQDRKTNVCKEKTRRVPTMYRRHLVEIRTRKSALGNPSTRPVLSPPTIFSHMFSFFLFLPSAYSQNVRRYTSTLPYASYPPICIPPPNLS